MTTKPLRGVILDVDGTLVDSNEAHANAWVEALDEAGVKAAIEDVRVLIGMGSDKLLPRVAHGLEADSPAGRKIGKRRGAIFKERYLPTLRPTPGARELLVAMRARGLTLLVASSAKADELGPLLEIVGAADLVAATTSSDDAKQSKPDPDIIHAAIARGKIPADALVMLGDTPYDIEAASRAHVGTIAVRSGGWKRDELRGALAVYAHCADLLTHYDASPLVRRAD